MISPGRKRRTARDSDRITSTRAASLPVAAASSRALGDGVTPARARATVAAGVAVTAALLAGCGPTSSAQDVSNFPERPVELVNPCAAGGSHDAHARAIASEIGDILGQPMTVSIKDGGAGALGATAVAKQSKPDGYTLLLGDQTSEPFRDSHAHLTHALRTEADGRSQYEVGAILLEHVDRAHIGREPLLNQVNDAGESFCGIAAV